MSELDYRMTDKTPMGWQIKRRYCGFDFASEQIIFHFGEQDGLELFERCIELKKRPADRIVFLRDALIDRKGWVPTRTELAKAHAFGSSVALALQGTNFRIESY